MIGRMRVENNKANVKRLARIISEEMQRLKWPDLGDIEAAVQQVMDEKAYDPVHKNRLCRIVGSILKAAEIVA